MNVAYLTHVLETNKLSEVVANIDLPALDINLAIWEAIDRGEIEVDEEKDFIKVLVVPAPSSDEAIKNKILRVIQHYAREKTNITRGRLNGYVKDPTSGQGYGWHEYIMAVQHLIDDNIIEQQVIETEPGVRVFKKNTGKTREKIVRPAHKFAFLGLLENSEVNSEWNQREVDKWIASFDKAMVK